jgi:hypothetical protein
VAAVPYEGVPTVNPETRAPDDYQREQANPAEAGGLIAQGEEKAGQGAEQASQNIFNIAQFKGKINTDNGVNQYITWHDNIMYGDPSKTTIGPDGKPIPDTGYYGLQGRAASDQRDTVLKSLEDQRNAIRKTLTSPQEQFDFDAQTRRMYADSVQRTGIHADQQWKGWAGGVNASGADLSLAAIARNPDDLEGFKHNTNDLINFRVKEAQLKFGDDPIILSQTVNEAKAEGTAARLQAIAVKDPSSALSLADSYKNTLSIVDKKTGQTFYDALSGQFRARANQQKSIGLADLAITKAGGETPDAVPGAQISPAVLHGAIIGRESNANPNSPTSIDNAHGIGQIIPATFKQFARPGENINDPVDNFNVSRRITDTYYKQFGGDPQRVAVAYFSGPNNVAPAGNPTPWIRDAEDGNHVRTSAYVAGITQRLTGAAAVKGSAYRYVMEQPDVDPVVRNEALTEINRRYSTAQIAADSDAKAVKLANDNAADGFVKRIGNGQTTNIISDITNNPQLTWETKNALWNIAEKHAGEDNPGTMGAGFNQVWNDILRPVGDPQRIADPVDILKRGGEGGNLTFAGTQKLLAIQKEAQKDINGIGLQQILNGAVANAKKSLSFETQFPTGGGVHDLDGERIFNTTFMNAFWSQYDSWIAKGNDPHQFPLLDPKKMEALTTQLRPRAQMAADRLAAVGEATGEQPNEQPQAAQPLPPTPENVDPAKWASVVSKPPLSASGKPWPYANWAGYVDSLRTDPTPENQQRFDTRMASSGITAKDILGALASTSVAKESDLADKPATDESLAHLQPAAEATPKPSLADTLHEREGAGPAGYLGNLIRSVTPQRVQEYVEGRK